MRRVDLRVLFVAAAAIVSTACGGGERVATIAADPSAGWTLAGPFSVQGLSPFEDGLDRDYLTGDGESGSGEKGAASGASLFRSAGGGNAAWREAAAGLLDTDGYGGVDFIAEYGRESYSVAYAFREIESAVERRVELKVGSDDGIKIWLNGEVVLARHVRRALAPGDDAAVATLRRGTNALLVKVEQAEGEWSFLLRMDDPAAGGADAPAVRSLAARPDYRSWTTGSEITGYVSAVPAACPDGAVRVELIDGLGAVRATAVAAIGGRFAVSPPSGLSGLAAIKAVGLGGYAGAASEPEVLLLGDARAMAETAAAAARRAANGAVPERAATLELLARSVEGSLPASLNGYGKAVAALAQIGKMTGSGRADRVVEGLGRYAYISSLDGSLQPYSLYIPAGYDPENRYGLVVTLHGATGNDFDQAAALAAAAPADLLIAAPFGRGDLSYVGAGERDVIDVMDLVCSRYGVDPARVYLTGSSMGGFGAWRIAQLYPSRFAALAPFAGWTGTELLDNLAGIPVLAVHGDADAVVPYSPDSEAVGILASQGADARLELLPGAGHDAFAVWTRDEGPGRLLDWFRRYRRVDWPPSVKVRTTMAAKGAAAWAGIAGIVDNRKAAGLDARVVDGRHVVVETENVSAFRLDLRHPDLAPGGRILILADGLNLTADSGKASAVFESGKDGRFRAAEADAAGIPANTGEGFAAIFGGPLRVVYGTRTGTAAGKNESIARSLAASLSGLVSVEVLSDRGYDASERAVPPAPETGTYSRVFIGSPADYPPSADYLPALHAVWKKGRYGIAANPNGPVLARGEGLLAALPDPERPGHLLALLSLPKAGAAADRLIYALAAPLRSGRPNDPCGYKLPDVMLLDRGGEVSSYAFFDWRWRYLDVVAAP